MKIASSIAGCYICTLQGSKWNGRSTSNHRVLVHGMHFLPLMSPRANEIKTAESMVNVEGGGGEAVEGITGKWRRWDEHTLPPSRLECFSSPFVWERLYIPPKAAWRPVMLSQMSHRMRRDSNWIHAGHAERQTWKEPQSIEGRPPPKQKGS